MSRPGSVERLWPGSTLICIAPGPSLTAADVEACAGYPVLTVNDAYLDAPWADVRYSSDVKWWKRNPEAGAFSGLKFAMPPIEHAVAGLTILGDAGTTGISNDPRTVCSGGHSGYAAINVAKHLVGVGGTIVLLGYDMQPGPTGTHHCRREHPDRSHPRYEKWLPLYATVAGLLATRGIVLINATRETAIQGVPRMELRSVLALQETAWPTLQ